MTVAMSGVQEADGVHAFARSQVLGSPSVTLLGLDEVSTDSSVWIRGMYEQSALFAHRGAIYFVAELR